MKVNTDYCLGCVYRDDECLPGRFWCKKFDKLIGYWGSTYVGCPERKEKMEKGLMLAEFVILAATALLLFAVVFGIKARIDNEKMCRRQLTAQGFNVKDIKVILKGTQYDVCDFLNSPTLQEKYISKDLSFFAEARNQKLARDAKNAAQGAMAMSTAAAVSAASRPVAIYR